MKIEAAPVNWSFLYECFDMSTISTNTTCHAIIDSVFQPSDKNDIEPHILRAKAPVNLQSFRTQTNWTNWISGHSIL